MKTYFKMPLGLKLKSNEELEHYVNHMKEGKFQHAWRHLERAHIPGQSWAAEHTHVHSLMLRFNFRIRSGHEIPGQIPGLLVGGVKPFGGKVPVENTGVANVLPLRSMEIPEDWKPMLRLYTNV